MTGAVSLTTSIVPLSNLVLSAPALFYLVIIRRSTDNQRHYINMRTSGKYYDLDRQSYAWIQVNTFQLLTSVILSTKQVLYTQFKRVYIKILPTNKLFCCHFHINCFASCLLNTIVLILRRMSGVRAVGSVHLLHQVFNCKGSLVNDCGEDTRAYGAEKTLTVA